MKKENKIYIRNIAEFKYGKSLPDRDRQDGTIPVYGSGGIIGYHNEAIVKEGIIIGRKGTVGSVKYSETPFFPIDTAFYVDQVTNGNNLKFFYYLLQSIGLENYDSDSAVPGLSRNLVHKLSVIVPDCESQISIANILSEFDKFIELNNQRIVLLEQTVRGIYKEWFVRFRFPTYKKTKFIKGIPEGWEIKKIADVCKVARGASPRPIVDQRFFVSGTIPWVKIADATASGKFLFETKEYVNEYGASFSRVLNPGSLIIATSGTLGFCIFLAIQACIHDGWLYTYDYKQSITPEFLFFVINDRTEYFNNISYGAAIQNINTDILRNTTFLKPTEEILTKFQKIISPINELQKNLQQQNTKLRQIRERLLPRLISGKLHVKNNIKLPQTISA